MFNYIVSLLSKKSLYPFNKEFRRGYKNAWINHIKEYNP